jgi:long-chain acyl-CoA synthetase
MLNCLGEVLPSAARRFGIEQRGARDVIAPSPSAAGPAFEHARGQSGAARHPSRRPRDALCAHSWEWLVSYYGALKTGAVINPINVMLTPAEVAFVTKIVAKGLDWKP